MKAPQWLVCLHHAARLGQVAEAREARVALNNPEALKMKSGYSTIILIVIQLGKVVDVMIASFNDMRTAFASMLISIDFIVANSSRFYSYQRIEHDLA